ncbi:hypothetical protein HK097_007030 [Rhizophlyctis rosea]|uniref:Aldehyde dehydrogenase domain-containing protein n=1 Tax=Rhizophlyctis rosea TaxID=64517 RepID=A0AAD5X4N7_9FUNG|nr:hypothetical protein HK097_007030 [Rhizophlyctis rosea]
MSDYTIISPVNEKPYKIVPLASNSDVDAALSRATTAFPAWKSTPLSERVNILSKFVDAFIAKKDVISEELAWLMGRPIKYNPNEVRGVEERARYLIKIAEESLKDIHVEQKEGFDRFIRREPLGLVFVIAAWNYPYLIAVNGVVPALLAGNVVILKQAPQTFPCAERFAEAFKEAGLPDGVFQYLHVDHPAAERVIQSPLVNHVIFTGSVRGGREVTKIAASRFVGVGLELGGKDPAYVRADADVSYAAENVVDGAMYNSGQSCCGIERVYVHESVYDEFVKKVVDVTKKYVLGDSLSPDTTLGPVVRKDAADLIREHIKEAVAKGATALVDEKLFPAAKEGTPYVAPQVLVNVNHNMRVMKEETFGPVVGIMKVSSDEEAIKLMNDSDFGLTASVWTKDSDAALQIGDQISTGTFFMNRCDYLDPALAWTGVKDSGRGCSLSKFGFDHLTRPKSFHLRVKI